MQIYVIMTNLLVLSEGLESTLQISFLLVLRTVPIQHFGQTVFVLVWSNSFLCCWSSSACYRWGINLLWFHRFGSSATTATTPPKSYTTSLARSAVTANLTTLAWYLPPQILSDWVPFGIDELARHLFNVSELIPEIGFVGLEFGCVLPVW